MAAWRRASSIVLRWLFGTALVSWRYMWQTTPLHREERRVDFLEEPPPPVPAGLMVDHAVQRDVDGVGRMFHRRFRVEIATPKIAAADLIAAVLRDFKRFVPSEVVNIRRIGSRAEDLSEGDDLVVEMPGPWDGPVRVVRVEDTCLRLATLRGHLESGQVRFQAWPNGDVLCFQVDVWARPSTDLVRLLYTRIRLAKEIQLNMWVRFCKAATATAGGRPNDGIHIRTHQVPSPPAQRGAYR